MARAPSGFAADQFREACAELQQPALAGADWQLLVEASGITIYRLLDQVAAAVWTRAGIGPSCPLGTGCSCGPDPADPTRPDPTRPGPARLDSAGPLQRGMGLLCHFAPRRSRGVRSFLEFRVRSGPPAEFVGYFIYSKPFADNPTVLGTGRDYI